MFDHDVAPAEVARHRLKPHQVCLELGEPGRGVDVHGLQGILADHAVRRKAMARLEALDGAVDIGVEGRGNASGLRQIAGDHQPLTQLLDGRIGNADFEPLGARRRDHRPASGGCDLLIIEDRLLQMCDRFGAENRRVGEDRRSRTRSLCVELVVPGAATRRIDDFVQRILSAGSTRPCGGTEGCGRAQKCAARESINSVLFRHSPTVSMRQKRAARALKRITRCALRLCIHASRVPKPMCAFGRHALARSWLTKVNPRATRPSNRFTFREQSRPGRRAAQPTSAIWT